MSKKKNTIYDIHMNIIVLSKENKDPYIAIDLENDSPSLIFFKKLFNSLINLNGGMYSKFQDFIDDFTDFNLELYYEYVKYLFIASIKNFTINLNNEINIETEYLKCDNDFIKHVLNIEDEILTEICGDFINEKKREFNEDEEENNKEEDIETYRKSIYKEILDYINDILFKKSNSYTISLNYNKNYFETTCCSDSIVYNIKSYIEDFSIFSYFKITKKPDNINSDFIVSYECKNIKIDEAKKLLDMNI